MLLASTVPVFLSLLNLLNTDDSIDDSKLYLEV